MISRKKVGQCEIYFESLNERVTINKVTPEKINKSWSSPIILKSGEGAFRPAQLGAIFAIKAHWIVSKESATIVMPTGTGKTETMIATVISEQCLKTLIIVPSKLLRKQTSTKFVSLGIIRTNRLVSDKVLNPLVAILEKGPASIEEIDEIISGSNIIVTTMALLSKMKNEYISRLKEKISHLIIDEAHHIEAQTWTRIKNEFINTPCLQFTATPFRNDGNRLDGKFIYVFPLSLAQEQGYFQPILFHPIIEFDKEKADFVIASEAVQLLEEDIKNHLEHILLVRVKRKDRAEDLYNNIYNNLYKKYNPVLVTSDFSDSINRESIKKLRLLESRIVVSVEMFGEGIDIPNLKIAAIHDKFKSLPITLQFIGRIARVGIGLGNAKVVANIVDEDIKHTLNDLYAQDADWNILLPTVSEQIIGKERSLQEVVRGFSGNGKDNIRIKQVTPKISTVIYKTDASGWLWHNWSKVLKEENCRHYINTDKSILIIVEGVNENVEWTDNREIFNVTWNLHVVYWNPEKKICFINTTDKSTAHELSQAIVPGSNRISGDLVFKCLHGINRLMLATVGLKTAINGPIRYKMFAGVDIAEGITEAQKENCYKSNLFGIGYNGKERVSIGCSHKGTIWSHWVDNIDFWINWCNNISSKILDPHINATDVLNGALIPKIIKARPQIKPYTIEWPIELSISNDMRILIKTTSSQYQIYDVDISLVEPGEEGPINFSISSDFKTVYSIDINETGFYIKHVSGNQVNIQYKKESIALEKFFEQYPPIVKFVDQSVLEGNYLVELKNRPPVHNFDKTIAWDWTGTTITKESQDQDKQNDSIQYRVIRELEKRGEYVVIFDDDDPGEIADVVAIRDCGEKIQIEFYHCKFSHGKSVGSRVADLYEVCGQAEKSVAWRQNMVSIVERMIKRELEKRAKGFNSRIEVGSLTILNTIKRKMEYYESDLKIFVVQPGFNQDSISEEMNRLLCSAQTYLMETYGVPFLAICS